MAIAIPCHVSHVGYKATVDIYMLHSYIYTHVIHIHKIHEDAIHTRDGYCRLCYGYYMLIAVLLEVGAAQYSLRYVYGASV